MESSEAAKLIRMAFEAWVKEVQGVAFLFTLGEPGYANQYTHPWTAGAWEAWKQLYVIGKS